MLDFLDDWLALRELPMAEIQARFGISEDHILSDANYEKLKGVTELHNPDSHPGYFYYQEGQFVLLYVGRSPQMDELDPSEMEEQLGEPAKQLPSRAGKTFNHLVYPDQGIAFSTNGLNVRILEIFPPMDFKSYKKRYYKKPPLFTR